MVYAFGLLGFENGLGSLGAGTGKTSFATLRTPDIPGASKTFGMRLQSEGGTTPVQGDVVAWSGKGNAVAVVLHIGVGAVDPTTTEKIVVAQGKKLG
jgi:hypothetical protein